MALKRYLLINSCFSLFTGILMLILTQQLNMFFDITNSWVFRIIGLNLVLFSLFVLFVALSKPIKQLLVKIIISLDALWVIGSISIIVFRLFQLSPIGYLLIGIIALLIGFLAFKQYQHYPQKNS